MSSHLKEFGGTSIRNKKLSVEWEFKRHRSYVVLECNGDSSGLFPLCFPTPPDPTIYYDEPSPWSLSPAKRCVDLVLASAALLLLWPVLAIIALLVRYESPGSAIFRQTRVGRHGTLFTVFKFRTMATAGHKEGPSLTKRGDLRVTTIGRFLRNYKLDELPQLFNVLGGQMSLVGPRPKVPHLEVMLMPVRPGLTGAATIAFRREEEMLRDIPDDDLEAYYCRMIKPLKAKLDGNYMRRATWATDFALLYKTVRCCVSARAECPPIDGSESA
jgi:lipopolysaccharide/colanic/teichoic acid biosynthesis glycosyltransferase